MTDVISASSNLEVSPDVWRSYVDAEFRHFVPQVTVVDSTAAWVMHGTEQVVPLPLNLFVSPDGKQVSQVSYGDGLPGTGDGAQHLRELDDDGITSEVLLPALFGRRALTRLPGEASIAVCRGYNDWLADYAAAAPDRLVGVGLLPASTLQDSLDELERVAAMPGVRGLQLTQFPNGTGGPSPEDDRFWSAAVVAGVVLVAHGDFGGGQQEDPTRTSAHMFTISFLTTKGGAPYSASELFTTGVFDRVPDLRVDDVHGSVAWVEFWAEQADDHYMRHKYWAGSAMPHPPSYYIKQHLLFNFGLDPVGLSIRQRLNLDNVMWGRDFPTLGGTWPRTADALEGQFADAGVDEALRQRLVGSNARRVFGLG